MLTKYVHANNADLVMFQHAVCSPRQPAHANNHDILPGEPARRSVRALLGTTSREMLPAASRAFTTFSLERTVVSIQSSAGMPSILKFSDGLVQGRRAAGDREYVRGIAGRHHFSDRSCRGNVHCSNDFAAADVKLVPVNAVSVTRRRSPTIEVIRRLSMLSAGTG